MTTDTDKIYDGVLSRLKGMRVRYDRAGVAEVRREIEDLLDWDVVKMEWVGGELVVQVAITMSNRVESDQ